MLNGERYLELWVIIHILCLFHNKNSMKKPCRNNSLSYENWLVVCTKRAALSAALLVHAALRLFAGAFEEYESLLEDLQRKERECPFLPVLKMIHRGNLNNRVSSTANDFLIFSL